MKESGQIPHSPVLALQHNIVAAFENPNGSAVELLRAAVEQGLLSHELDLRMDATPPTPPRVIRRQGEPAFIQLHLSHLELLWAFIYGWIVLYEEAIQRPWLEGRFDGHVRLESDLTVRAAAMLEWASGLRQAHTQWPEGLPTPLGSDNEREREYAFKANGIFESAVAFLLFHEFGHVRQGHLGNVDQNDDTEGGRATAIQMEREADQFAFDVLVSQHDDDEAKAKKAWAVLAPALSSLYLLDGHVGIFQRRHPHLHHRIHDLLAKLRFEDERYRFYYHYLAVTVLDDVDEAFNDEMDSLDDFLGQRP